LFDFFIFTGAARFSAFGGSNVFTEFADFSITILIGYGAIRI